MIGRLKIDKRVRFASNIAVGMRSENASPLQAALTAAIVTTATFAKSFVPFYLIGSTPIFVATCALGLMLIARASQRLADQASYAPDIWAALVLLYSVVTANFLFSSLHQVPVTHLLGILIFHGLFLLFGFAAAGSLQAVFIMLLLQACAYLIIVARYVIRFGDMMQNGFLQDVFGVGVPELITTMHQHIGTALALALLAMGGLRSKWARLLAWATLPFVLSFMFHIAARTAMVALLGGLVFLAGAALWTRSRKIALASLCILLLSGMLTSGLFYRYALKDQTVDKVAADAISRTIREIQSRDPGFRLQIWSRAWQRISSQPDRLAFGRGIGVYPIDEGFGAPNWLLRPAEGNKYYPHNLHLELLYETGIPGFLIFTILTLLPLFFSLKHWDWFSAPERAAIAIYVFYLVTVEISGSFAYSYDFQFFYGLAAGVVALKRWELTETGAGPIPAKASRVLEIGEAAT